jgi:hypothetical protein
MILETSRPKIAIRPSRIYPHGCQARWLTIFRAEKCVVISQILLRPRWIKQASRPSRPPEMHTESFSIRIC